MFEREKIEIRTLRNYLSSSEFVLRGADSNSSAVLFVPPPSSPHIAGSGDFIPRPRRGNTGPSSSLAIRAAISGLDEELARLDREERSLDGSRAPSGSSAEAAAAAEEAAFLSGEFVTMSREDVVAAVRNGNSDIGDGDAKMMTDDDDDDDWEVANTKIIDASRDEKNNNIRDDEKEDETSRIPNRGRRMTELLASDVVKRISTCNIKVKTELGVIGLALHAAILALGSGERRRQQSVSESEQYELLKCTGIPSDVNVIHQLLRNHFRITKDENDNSSSRKGGGFAPPIRELPRGQLVPSNWEEMTTSLSSVVAADHDIIALRYKLVSGTNSSTYSVDSSTVLGVGGTTDASSTTLYLVVILPHSSGGKEKNSEVHVSFGTLHPSSSTTNTTTTPPTTRIMTFPLGQYVNLDGYKAAKAKVAGGSVTPCLFYIALSELLYQFVTKFESVLRRRKVAETPALSSSSSSSSSSLPLGYTNIMTMDDGINCRNNSNAMVAPPPTMDDDKGITTHSIIPHVDGGDDELVVGPPRIAVGDDTTLFPPPHRCGGDFESDLLPSGLPSLSVVLPSNLLLPGGGGGNSGGSQVGPNHPMFDRTFGDDDDNYYYGGNFSLPGGIGGGCGGGGMDMGMRPRFDPYGPPGGPTEPGRGPNFPGRGGGGGRLGRGGFGRGGRGRGGGFPPPGGFGTPNNDHMTPPGGDYFS